MGCYNGIKPDNTTISMPTLSTKWEQAHSAEKLAIIEKYISESAEQEDIEPVAHEVIFTQLHHGQESRVKGELKTARSFYSIALGLLVAGPSGLIRDFYAEELRGSLIEKNPKDISAKSQDIYGILKELLAQVIPSFGTINEFQQRTAETQQRTAELLRQLEESNKQIKQRIKQLPNAEITHQGSYARAREYPDITPLDTSALALGIIGDNEDVGAKESINLIRDHINRHGDELSTLELSQQLLDLKLPIRFELPCLLLPKMYHLSEATVAKALGIPTSTFNRYKINDAQKNVPEELAEKIIIFIQLLERGITIFNSKNLMALWLTTPNEVFDMKKPVDYMQTIGQRIEAIRLLEQFNANSYR